MSTYYEKFTIFDTFIYTFNVLLKNDVPFPVKFLSFVIFYMRHSSIFWFSSYLFSFLHVCSHLPLPPANAATFPVPGDGLPDRVTSLFFGLAHIKTAVNTCIFCRILHSVTILFIPLQSNQIFMTVQE